MRFLARSRDAVVGVLLLALVAQLIVPAAALAAGENRRICQHEPSSRVDIPTNLLLEACFDGAALHVYNQLSFVVAVNTSVNPDLLERRRVDGGDTAADVVATVGRTTPNVLPPGYAVRIPVGTEALSISFSFVDDAESMYAWSKVFAPFIPFDALFGFVSEIGGVGERYARCMAEGRFLGSISCRADLVADSTFAFGRLVIKGVPINPLRTAQIIIDAVDLGRWSYKHVADLRSVVQSNTASLTVQAKARPTTTASIAPRSTTSRPTPTTTGKARLSATARPKTCVDSRCGLVVIPVGGITPGARVTWTITHPGGFVQDGDAWTERTGTEDASVNFTGYDTQPGKYRFTFRDSLSGETAIATLTVTERSRPSTTTTRPPPTTTTTRPTTTTTPQAPALHVATQYTANAPDETIFNHSTPGQPAFCFEFYVRAPYDGVFGIKFDDNVGSPAATPSAPAGEVDYHKFVTPPSDQKAGTNSWKMGYCRGVPSPNQELRLAVRVYDTKTGATIDTAQLVRRVADGSQYPPPD